MTVVSIITITRNNREMIDNYMKALFKNTIARDFELILIDNASTEEESKHLEQLVKEYSYFNEMAIIKLLKNKKMKSFAANCNMGAKISQSDLLFFLNDDTEVQPNWLGPLRETIASSDGHYEGFRIAAVGPKMYFPNGNIQHCGIAFHEKDRMPGHMWWNKKHKDDPIVNKKRRVTAITGGALMIKKRIFEEVGGFDEIYEVCAYEDIDLCLRLNEKKMVIKYEPLSEILHHESVTQKKFSDNFRKDYFIKNTTIFLNKWYDKILPDFNKMTYGDEK